MEGREESRGVKGRGEEETNVAYSLMMVTETLEKP